MLFVALPAMELVWRWSSGVKKQSRLYLRVETAFSKFGRCLCGLNPNLVELTMYYVCTEINVFQKT